MQEGEGVGGEQEQQLVEEASPISSRPPASASVNLDEFMGLSDGGGGGGGGIGGSSGNRWPRQETLALLKIRSDMDASFRDATLKGPLWEDVSRKLAELGYKRSAKKCKEKFENVHKYYKRTKEGRAGRQDGKSYKFFSQLEALHSATTQTSNQFVAAVNPMPISSFRASPSISTAPSKLPSTSTTIPMDMTKPSTHATTPAMTTSTAGIFPAGVISFSSNSSSSSPSSQDIDDDDDAEDDDLEGEPSNVSRKRKRESWKEGSHRMMEFFENLMKQVMQKQEAMQQKFLEIIEKREQERMIREEAWKRQEMARLSREHELMAQERAISASRDAAIISFLQKITGQTIQLPPTGNTIHPAPPAPAPAPAPPPPAVVPQLTQKQQQQQKHIDQSQSTQHQQQQPSVSTDAAALAVNTEQHATPQLEFTGGSNTTLEATSSRWPKAEVVALINLRSGLESRYHEVGPKGPLWEEISAGMQRMGYKRSAKRCKEKWENINKYFKKVKESSKKRPDDAKTCPYFHQLDALYRKKVNIIGSSSAHAGEQHSISAAKQTQDKSDAETSMAAPNPQPPPVRESEDKTAATTDVEITSSLGLPSSFFGEGTGGASKKPEDIVKELMERQENHQQQPPVQHLVVDDYDKIEEPDSEDIEQEDEDEDEDEDDNEELEDHERKMAYKIEFQRQKAAGTSATEGGNGAPSFLAMVQ